jgi:endonuclease/exonuclease/phosphatase (EEP) superfamily protein YafD
MSAKPFRILLLNVGYATALDGSIKDYLLRFYRYLYTSREIIRRVRQAIYTLLERESPDVCCFVELRKHKACVPHLHAYECSDVDNKYGQESVLRRLPFFRNNCNGFYAKAELPFTKAYFKSGTKKLIYDIQVRPDLSLLIVHFALKAETRRRQCAELKEIIGTRRNVIVCGDFNIFRGAGELQDLADACDLQIVSPQTATFPSARPSKTLDLFLCPRAMGSVSARVMHGVKASDHLPVMLEMQL